jgi:hypothetical protein
VLKELTTVRVNTINATLIGISGLALLDVSNASMYMGFLKLKKLCMSYQRRTKNVQNIMINEKELNNPLLLFSSRLYYKCSKEKGEIKMTRDEYDMIRAKLEGNVSAYSRMLIETVRDGSMFYGSPHDLCDKLENYLKQQRELDEKYLASIGQWSK